MFGQDDQQHQNDSNQPWQQPSDTNQHDGSNDQPQPQTAPPAPPAPDPNVMHTGSLEEQPTESVSEPQQNDVWGQAAPQVTSPTAATPAPASSDDLLAIKQKALEDLSPLVSHLDQTPEEKFNTTLMMIKATDNQSLLPDAYQAAQAITDEKKRAQALLEVVNEVNYFTQQQQNQQ